MEQVLAEYSRLSESFDATHDFMEIVGQSACALPDSDMQILLQLPHRPPAFVRRGEVQQWVRLTCLNRACFAGCAVLVVNSGTREVVQAEQVLVASQQPMLVYTEAAVHQSSPELAEDHSAVLQTFGHRMHWLRRQVGRYRNDTQLDIDPAVEEVFISRLAGCR